MRVAIRTMVASVLGLCEATGEDVSPEEKRI